MVICFFTISIMISTMSVVMAYTSGPVSSNSSMLDRSLFDGNIVKVPFINGNRFEIENNSAIPFDIISDDNLAKCDDNFSQKIDLFTIN